MKVFPFLFLILLSNNLFAQKVKDEVLFTINDEPVMVSEFKRVYEKNIDLVDSKEKDIDKNLEMYIDYKLKVKEAYNLKLDTIASYKKEFSKYKKQLIAPYLRDKNFEAEQLKIAYERTKEEIRASHILILFPKKGKVDTLGMISKLNTLRERIHKGESFEKLAKEFSEDPSAKYNGGDLGYFSAFKMVAPFEDKAYETPKGKISAPFKTRFGYHILKVTDKRPSLGQFSVAHILVANSNSSAKTVIDDVYQKLESGIDFKILAQEYSDDLGTKKTGGVLPKFGSGRMVLSFEREVKAIEKEGTYSKPFQTKYGWHIVKLLKKYPIKSFKEEKKGLLKKINKNRPVNLSQKEVVKKLLKEYAVTENKGNLISLLNGKEADKNLVLFAIEEDVNTIDDFTSFSKKNRKKISKELYTAFLENEILNYFKKDLEENNENFKFVLKEYKEGLLLFDLLQNKIWNKAAKDTLGLQQFYNLNKAKYNHKPLESVKNKVINDYQNHLEKKWVNELRSKNTFTIKKKVLKRFKLKNRIQ